VVRPRSLARRGEVPAADQAHVRDRIMRGTERVGLDQRCAGTREASDAVEARSLEGFGAQHQREQCRFLRTWASARWSQGSAGEAGALFAGYRSYSAVGPSMNDTTRLASGMGTSWRR
jgi:hypothetical protein